MEARILFKKISQFEISRKYFWLRPLILVSESDFMDFKDFFSDGKLLGKKMNYRSKHSWVHIHAIGHNNLVQIHIDYGNLYKNFLWIIPHFFIDMVPYFTWHLLCLRMPYDF